MTIFICFGKAAKVYLKMSQIKREKPQPSWEPSQQGGLRLRSSGWCSPHKPPRHASVACLILHALACKVWYLLLFSTVNGTAVVRFVCSQIQAVSRSLVLPAAHRAVTHGHGAEEDWRREYRRVSQFLLSNWRQLFL